MFAVQLDQRKPPKFIPSKYTRYTVVFTSFSYCYSKSIVLYLSLYYIRCYVTQQSLYNHVIPHRVAMATLARSVIANEYSMADEPGAMYPGDEVLLLPQKPDEISVGSGGVASSEGGGASDGTREESPASSSSSAEPFDPVVSGWGWSLCLYLYIQQM